MVDETNKDETQNKAQAEASDGGVGKPENIENQPQNKDLKSDPSSSDPSTESSKGPASSMESVMDMYEESFKRFAEGEVVTGRIISIDKDHVLVDIGYKSEGQVRIQEFTDEKGNVKAKVGDSIEVMVEWWDDEDERVLLSKDKAANIKVWEAIKKSYDDEGTVKGTITNRVKGGFSVDIGVPAFLPGSQADLRPIRNLDDMVGKEFDFKILKYNRKRSNIVLSRRAILEKELEEKRSATLTTIHEGKVVEGIVKNMVFSWIWVVLMVCFTLPTSPGDGLNTPQSFFQSGIPSRSRF
jgi:small subunit ribosomal protein S1